MRAVRPTLVEGRAAASRLLHQMTEAHEAAQPTPWAMGDLDAGKLEQLLDALVVFEMPVTSLEGKWKLSQNREPQDKAAFIEAVEARGDIDLAEANETGLNRVIAGCVRGVRGLELPRNSTFEPSRF